MGDYVRTTRYPMFAGFTTSTPVLPQLYWDVYSAEQRWKHICQWLKKLTEYADYINENVSKNADDIEQLQADLKQMRTDLEELATTIEETVLKELEEQLIAINEKIEQTSKEAKDYTNAQLENYATLAQFETEQLRVNALVQAIQEAIATLTARIDQLEYNNTQWDVSEARMNDTTSAQRHMFNYTTGNAASCEEIAEADSPYYTGAFADTTCDAIAESGLNVRGFAVHNMNWIDVSSLAFYYRVA